jgi:cell division protein FtsL
MKKDNETMRTNINDEDNEIIEITSDDSTEEFDSTQEFVNPNLEEDMSSEENNSLEDTLTEETLDDIPVRSQHEEVEETLENDEEQSSPEEKEEPVKDKKHTKFKLKKWHDMTKKEKIITICVIVVVILLIAFLVWFFAFRSKKTQEQVIVQEDNYRYENGKLIFMDKDKKDIGEYECTNKDQKLCYVAYYSKDEYLDSTKYIDEDKKDYQFRSSIIQNNFVFVFDNASTQESELKLYNMKTKSVDGKYDEVKNYKDNEVIVMDKDKSYGILDFSEDKVETKVDLKYNYLGCNNVNDLIAYEDKTGYGLMDIDSKTKATKIKHPIKNYNSKFIAVINDANKYLLNDYSGKDLGITADYITFSEDYVIVISDGLLNVYDSDLNILNMEPIKIDATEYNKVITLDKDGKVKDEKDAFKVTINADTIAIEIGSDSKVISKYEGKLNGSLSYINYSDSVLYFYSDANKTKLIGKYTCSTKNEINASTTSYTSCFIAKETKMLNRPNSTGNAGYLPIYNDRYVFIQDGTDINMYDLTNNKKLSTYSAVDVGFYNDQNTVNMATASNVLALAKKSDNTFGIIKITGSSVTAMISFNDKSTDIKYLNNDLLARYQDGTYHLFKTDGTEITKNITTTSEIKGYYSNYLLVNNQSGYQIYNLETGKIVSEAMNYIEMRGTYYIGIDGSNNLNLYRYTDNSQILCNKNIKVIKKDSYDKSYKVTATGSGYEIITYNEDGTEIHSTGACE